MSMIIKMMVKNQRNQMTHNVNRDLGINLVITQYDGKLKPIIEDIKDDIAK